MQAQGVGGGRLKYCSMTDVIVKTVKNEGFLGLYKVAMHLTSMATHAIRPCNPPLRCGVRCLLAGHRCHDVLLAGRGPQFVQAGPRCGHQLVHI